jgi:4-amino-4-deoxy-L-arabinose transferase-like glycosyltransferase
LLSLCFFTAGGHPHLAAARLIWARIVMTPPRPKSWSRWLALLAVGLLIASGYFYRPAATSAELVWADTLMLLGGLILGVAWWLALRLAKDRHLSTISDDDSSPMQSTFPNWRGWLITAAGVICLAVMAEGNSPRGTLYFHPQFMLWCAGVVLVTWGLATGGKSTFAGRSSDKAGGNQRLHVPTRYARINVLDGINRWRRFASPLILITLLGLVLRMVALEDALHIFVDETNFVIGVLQLWQPELDINILTPFGSITAFPWIYPYLQMLTVELVGPTLSAMRLISVFFGTLTIPALYLLAKELFDRRTALWAALLLATFPPHVHFSRLGMNNIADPFFGTLALGFMLRGIRTHRRRDWVWAGAALGLTQYFYEGGRLIFPVLALLLLLMVWKTQRTKYTWKNVFFFLLAFGLIIAPLYYTLFAWQSNLTPRLETQRIWEGYWFTLLLEPDGFNQIQLYFREQFNPALLHLIHLPDGGEAFYGGATALILPYFVPVFLLGMFHVIWRWRKAGILLLLWILFTALGNSLLYESTWSARFVVVLPALVLLMAVGIRYTLALLLPDSDARPLRQSAWLQRVIMLGIMALIAYQPVYYFGPHLHLFNRQLRPFKDGQDVMYRAVDFPPGTHVYVLGTELMFPPHVTILQAFWETDLNFYHVHPLELLLLDIHRLPRDADLAFFVEEDDRDTLQHLARVFDLDGPQYSPYNVPREKQFVLYYVHRPPDGE